MPDSVKVPRGRREHYMIEKTTLIT